MKKKTYKYQQVQVPYEAKEAFDALHEHMSGDWKLRKAELWIAVIQTFSQLSADEWEAKMKELELGIYGEIK